MMGATHGQLAGEPHARRNSARARPTRDPGPRHWCPRGAPRPPWGALTRSAEGPMYGSRSSPVRWETRAARALEQELNFRRGENDRSIYYRAADDIRILIYVDDIVADGAPAALAKFFEEVRGIFDLRTVHTLTAEQSIDFIGINISTDGTRIFMDMEDYARTAVEYMEQHMQIPRTARVPIKSYIAESPTLDAKRAKAFRTGLGMIGWLSATIRIDLSYAHSRIAKYMATPTEAAWDALRIAYAYIRSTVNLCISAPMHAPTSEYSFYTDADHAGNREPVNKTRSQLGEIALINGTPFHWRSATESIASISKLESETLPSISVGEAETRAYANGVHSFIHLSYLASEMQLDPLPAPIIINTDSTVAIAFATNTQLKTRMKHLDVRQHWISMIRDLSIARPIHCSSQNNIADLLTKIHPGPRFQQLVSKLMWTKTYY